MVSHAKQKSFKYPKALMGTNAYILMHQLLYILYYENPQVINYA